MPRKREIKIEFTRPLKINRTAIKLIAEGFLEWWEEEGYKKHLEKTEAKNKDANAVTHEKMSNKLIIIVIKNSRLVCGLIYRNNIIKLTY